MYYSKKPFSIPSSSFKKTSYNNKDSLKQFKFDEPVSSPTLSRVLQLNEEAVLAHIFDRECDCCHEPDHGCGCSKCFDKHAVWLAATVGWRGSSSASNGGVIEFRIRKGSRNGEVIFATRDGVGVDQEELAARTTSFTHVDASCHTNSWNDGHAKYFLTATLISTENPGDTAVITGPVVFTAAVIE
ncbi:MAG: hypothetical protein ACE3JP_03600 [Ectobacillus sp.]